MGEFPIPADERAYKEWSATAEVIETSLGRRAVEEAANCAWRLVERLEGRLLERWPAHVQEAALKFGVLMTLLRSDGGDPNGPGYLNDFLDDLVALAAPRPK